MDHGAEGEEMDEDLEGQEDLGNVAGGSEPVGSVETSVATIDKLHNTGFAGEQHAILVLPDGSLETANFMGPGTELIKRLRRGDQGLTACDQVAKLHDILYGLAQFATDDKEQEKLIRQADMIMVLQIMSIEDQKADHHTNIMLGKRLIQLKMKGEDWKLIRPAVFGGSRFTPEERFTRESERELLHAHGRETFDLLSRFSSRVIKEIITHPIPELTVTGWKRRPFTSGDRIRRRWEKLKRKRRM